MLGLRQRIEDARETMTRAAASVRRSLSRLRFEVAVQKVLEEKGDIHGENADVGCDPRDSGGFPVFDKYGEGGGMYSTEREAARAFVAIERSGASLGSHPGVEDCEAEPDAEQKAAAIDAFLSAHPDARFEKGGA